MKVSKTLVLLATFCCASAFGLNGATAKTGLATKIGFAAQRGSRGQAPMVQAIDVQGQRLSMVRC